MDVRTAKNEKRIIVSTNVKGESKMDPLNLA